MLQSRLIRGLVIAVLVLSAGAAGGTFAVPSPSSAQGQPEAAAAPRHGPFAVGARIETFVDTSRSTPANGSVAGHPGRTLKTLILYPAEGTPGITPAIDAAATPEDLVKLIGDRHPVRRSGRFPLVAYAHGFAGGFSTTRGLALAEAGYVVAAPDFPLTRFDAPGGPNGVDYVNQPGDVSFVISRMLGLPVRDRDIERIIRPHGIGVFGVSLGVTTVLGVTFNSCCRDPRIDAAVSIAGGFLVGVPGAEAPFPNGTYFTGPPVPMLVIHGTADPFAPYQGGVQLFHDAPAPKFFVTLIGAQHVSFGPPWESVAIRTQNDFFDRYLKHEPRALKRLRTDGNVPGVATLQQVLRPK